MRNRGRAIHALRRAGLACGVAVLAGCSSLRPTPVAGTAYQFPRQPPAPPAPPVPSRCAQFQKAVSSLTEQVQLLRIAPASLDDTSVYRAVRTLADAVENTPDARGVDVVAASNGIRELFPETVGGQPRAQVTHHLRAALQSASGALLLLAHGPYAASDAIAADARAFRLTADALEADEPIAAQPQQVVASLAQAERTLRAVERAAGLVPLPVVRAPVVPPSAAPGVAETEPGGPPPAECPSTAYGAALTSYSTWVDRFALLPPEHSAAALSQSFDALATAIDAMPHGEGLAPWQDAAALRGIAQHLWWAPPLTIDQADIARDGFSRAWTFFAAAARQAYASAPAVGDAARALHEQYVTIDPSKPLGSQRSQVLGSLEAVERVPRAMAQAAGGPG